ncbi:MAG TPA: hypothetical protein VIU93_11430 [Gallionellaceae bacterium]
MTEFSCVRSEKPSEVMDEMRAFASRNGLARALDASTVFAHARQKAHR